MTISDAERKAIRTAFARAVGSYDSVAQVQREAASALLSLCAADQPRVVLDAGCGTGHGGSLLAEVYPQAMIISLDTAHAMCVAAGRRALCGDIEHLPLASSCCDMYWSSLAWQWTDPRRSVTEAARILKPGGALRVATLGPGTLKELRGAFATVDDARHVRDFFPVEGYAPLLEAAGFAAAQIVRRPVLAYAEDLSGLLRAIRDLGAHTVGPERRRSLLGRRSWECLCRAYERWRTPRGLPATYDVVHLIATRS